jgi:hypothetical protein
MRWKLARRLILATGVAAVILAAAPAQEEDDPGSGSALAVTRSSRGGSKSGSRWMRDRPSRRTLGISSSSP